MITYTTKSVRRKKGLDVGVAVAVHLTMTDDSCPNVTFLRICEKNLNLDLWL